MEAKGGFIDEDDLRSKVAKTKPHEAVVISPASAAEIASGKGTKDDFLKPRMDLLPSEPLEEIARVLEFGARKYTAHNWRNGMVFGRPFAAVIRHLWAWWRGEDKDPETGLSHLAHAGCMLLFLHTYEITKTGTDDRYRPSKGA